MLVQPGTITDPGMSLRDYFAGQALAGWSESHHSMVCTDDLEPYRVLMARTAYGIADAMLNEREGEPEKPVDADTLDMFDDKA